MPDEVIVYDENGNPHRLVRPDRNAWQPNQAPLIPQQPQVAPQPQPDPQIQDLQPQDEVQTQTFIREPQTGVTFERRVRSNPLHYVPFKPLIIGRQDHPDYSQRPPLRAFSPMKDEPIFNKFGEIAGYRKRFYIPKMIYKL